MNQTIYYHNEFIPLSLVLNYGRFLFVINVGILAAES